jgi:hypothetical protein
VLQALVERQLKFQRIQPPKEERQVVEERQGYKCAKCGEDSVVLQIDHIQPLREGGANKLSNYHALCVACHSRKTYEEQMVNLENRDPLASVLSPETFECFHKSAKPKQFVLPLRANRARYMEIDAVKSRRNALAQSQDPLPVFCVLDAPRRVEGPEPLSDYMFVDKGEVEWGTGLRATRFLPYTGRRWYCRQAVRVMFERGVISWADVKLALQASSHLDPQVLRQAILDMEETASEAQRFEADAKPWEAAKVFPRAAIGLLNAGAQYAYVCRTSNCSEDAHFSKGAHKRKIKDPCCVAPALKDGLVYDYVKRIELKTWRSHRPIGQIALDMDLVHIAEALDIARKYCVPKQLLGFNTDCVQVDCAAIQREKLKDAVKTRKYLDGSPMFAVKVPDEKSASLRKDATDDVALQRSPPVADADLPELTRPWVDAQNPSADQVAQAVVDHGGALLVGAGGTGKTYTARSVIGILRDLGYSVEVVAFTHLAAQNIGGKTIHAFLHACPTFKGVIVVDEASFVPVTLWGELAKYVHCGASFLALGDFRGQFLPAHNTWRGTEIEADVEESAFLRTLCGCRRFELAVNRRSDPELFGFYAPICKGGAREHESLQNLLQEARARFPASGCDVSIKWHLCISNKARIALNKRVNEFEARQYQRLTGEAAELLEAPPNSELQQDILMFPGLRLVGSRTEEGVKNGVFYCVQTPRDGNKTVLQVVGGAGDTVRIYTNKVASHLRPAAALTYFGSQGRTLDGTVRLHDTRSPFFTKRHLVVGVGRATSSTLAQVM